MSDRSNIFVGLLALAATLAVIPAAMDLAQDSGRRRQAVAALRVPKVFEIRGTRILDPAMYLIQKASAGRSAQGLQLVAVVASQAQAHAAIGVWNSVGAEPLSLRASMTFLLVEVGGQHVPEAIPAGVSVSRVKDAGEFSARTGIRTLPFSLIIAGSDHVLAAGLGLPDTSFVRGAAERFIREGASATTVFRPMTLELAAGLASIETLFPAGAAVR